MKYVALIYNNPGAFEALSPAERDQLMSEADAYLKEYTDTGELLTGGYALADDPATISLGRVIRLLDGALAPLPCVSLRYYDRCSCPDEATCPLRDVMIDVRDAMLEILDSETLAELAGRQGRAAIDPRGLHADALAGRRP